MLAARIETLGRLFSKFWAVEGIQAIYDEIGKTSWILKKIFLVQHHFSQHSLPRVWLGYCLRKSLYMLLKIHPYENNWSSRRWITRK